MTDKDKKRPEDIVADIDARLGGLLGNVGAALSEMLERLDDDGNGEVRRDTVFDTGKGPVRAQAGIRVSLAGQTLSRETGVPKPPKPVTPRPKTPQPAIDAAVDSFFDGSIWTLTADLPGVSQEEVQIDVKNGVLTLETTGRRRYRAEISIPDQIEIEEREQSLLNGVLELTAPVRGDHA